ncbi:hypothetical protein FNV43_RR20998 [Rhamnella rubrinervis]|uniref:Uncharacterized protein n=1 Tax=Rhamnella rubrinervis TaxID=2594499 RepID=A0A8K0GR04_9ROSA|nr:hypothetical protein FNV43_RR20998 [Rhamnella rubrinervis]
MSRITNQQRFDSHQQLGELASIPSRLENLEAYLSLELDELAYESRHWRASTSRWRRGKRPSGLSENRHTHQAAPERSTREAKLEETKLTMATMYLGGDAVGGGPSMSIYKKIDALSILGRPRRNSKLNSSPRMLITLRPQLESKACVPYETM